MPSCIILTGDPVAGFEAVGPFPSEPAAVAWQQAQPHADEWTYWVLKCEGPAPTTTGETS